MGLDPVELVYSFERYFSLDIPDPVCEKLYTVGDVTAYISERLGVAGRRQSAVREAVRQQLSEVLKLPPGAFDANITVQDELPTAAVAWLRQELKKQYEPAVPELPSKPHLPPASLSFIEKLLGIQPRPSQVPWPAQSLAALADWVVALNYEKLLPRPPCSAYEVAQAIVGIINSSGISVEENRVEQQLYLRFRHGPTRLA